MITLLNISGESKQKLNFWLNDSLFAWNLWSGNIRAGFVQVYDSGVKADDKGLVGKFDAIIDVLNKLVKNPGDEELKEDFEAAVDSMKFKIDLIHGDLDDLVYNLNAFLKSFDAQKANFLSIFDLICKEKGLKEDAKKALKDEIDTFNDKVRELKKQIAIMAVIDGVAILGSIASIVGAFFTAGVSLLALFATLPVVGVTSYMIDTYRKAMKDLNNSIDTDKQKISGLTDDIVALTALNTAIKEVSDKDEAIKGFVEKAKAPWDALSDDMDRIAKDITITEGGNYGDYLKSFSEAKELWKDVFIPQLKELELPQTKVVIPPADFIINTPGDWNLAVTKFSVGIEEFYMKRRSA